MVINGATLLLLSLEVVDSGAEEFATVLEELLSVVLDTCESLLSELGADPVEVVVLELSDICSLEMLRGGAPVVPVVSPLTDKVVLKPNQIAATNSRTLFVTNFFIFFSFLNLHLFYKIIISLGITVVRLKGT